MSKHSGRRLLARGAILALLGISVVAIPASGAPGLGQRLTSAALAKLSEGAVMQALLAHPEQAPEELRARFERERSILAASSKARSVGRDLQMQGVFNRDIDGVPQHEESITRCSSGPNVVLGGTIDLRGEFPQFQDSITGWDFSTDAGQSVANEGLLPPVAVAGSPAGDHVSAGDPVDVSDQACNLFAASLNSNIPEAGFVPNSNSIAVYRSNPPTLTTCPGGNDGSCWPVRRAVAVNEDGHFLDKPWLDVGVSGSAGEVVWVVYTDFCFPRDATECGGSAPFFTTQIKAVRCNPTLTSCTDPILISGEQNSLGLGDVTIGPDGRVYITWEEDNDLANGFQPPEHMRFWLRVAEPGSTTFGPMRLVANEPLNLGLADLHANEFRVATYPKNDVAMVDGHPRVFVVWDGCSARTFGETVCEEPQTKLVYSDDLGATFTAPRVVSKGGDNYFSTISSNGDSRNPKLAIAYYTSRFDPQFHNRQDIELVSVDASSGQVTRRERLTGLSNDPEADPISGGFFIGDYIEVTALGNQALVHFTANYRQVPLLGEGVPIPQQDNFLKMGHLGE